MVAANVTKLAGALLIISTILLWLQPMRLACRCITNNCYCRAELSSVLKHIVLSCALKPPYYTNLAGKLNLKEMSYEEIPHRCRYSVKCSSKEGVP